jgi:acetylornithine deacetylase
MSGRELPAAAAPDRVHELLARLVGFDTSSHLSNLPLLAFVEDYLGRFGIGCERVHNAEGTKANLHAVIGPAAPGGVILSAHTDVVPAAGQPWTTDPFTLTRRGDRLYGRGSSDMKGFIACALAAVPDMIDAGLKRPVHLALSYDEEVGCLGAPSLVASLVRRPDAPRLCLVGEPTGMQVVIAHKGRMSFRVEVTGTERHSAYAPDGANAVEGAARLAAFISDIAWRKRSDGPVDPAFDVPFTTLSVGRFDGGTSLNVVPGACRFDFEIRDMPPDDPQSILAEVRAFACDQVLPRLRANGAGADIRFTLLAERPALDTPVGARVVDLARAICGRNDIGKVSFGTDAAHFQKAGIETAVVGPGDITRAHRADEYILVSELARGSAMLGRLIEELRI